MLRGSVVFILVTMLVSCSQFDEPTNLSENNQNKSAGGSTTSDSFYSENTITSADTMKSYDFYSSNVGDTFVIDISLPKNYSADTSVSYPVVYITDGYWRRAQHQPIHDMVITDNVKEVIIVGISYPANYNPDQIRVRDLITHADRFLDFICKELIPYIENNYRTNGLRTLCGASYGGYFTMYALFQNYNKTKNVFKNYIVASPTCYQTTYSPDYDREINLFGYEEVLSMNTQELNVNLYLAVGALEDDYWFIEPFNKLVAQIESRNYGGLFLKTFIDPGKDHYTVWVPALYEGIRLFLKNDMTSVR